jgi:hypothetical protein
MKWITVNAVVRGIGALGREQSEFDFDSKPQLCEGCAAKITRPLARITLIPMLMIVEECLSLSSVLSVGVLVVSKIVSG